ncbi:MAG TPA: molecular chaperone HtpG [Flavobacteriales bacterium]|nr:molecular chaperone HtpG [Flavobacteriales bacterium]
MTKGKIKVSSDNIFPIIKKFLYSDHEIFLRELISNAIDASKKLQALETMGKFKGEIGDLTIQVEVDKAAKTITIKDRGVGMDEQEVEKYINDIALSGAEEFVSKYKDKTDVANLIGHFGLGFYSSFMVADNVDIITKSHKKTAKAVKWSCDGSPNYTLIDDARKERGTDVVIHVSDDSSEFLEDSRIRELLNKYCKFLPVKIQFGTNEETVQDKDGKVVKDKDDKDKKITTPNIINNTSPAWKKQPSKLKDDDYRNFYRELYPMNFEEPLFQIHLNVDYPFNLTGILYFPKLKNKVEVQKDKIQLYANQVFVTDSVEGIVPDFLTLLHGVLDSPDIPLNISRSYLQSDARVKQISGHITKKVADKLEKLFKKDRKDFESKWDDIKIFIDYGMISEDKFYDKALSFALLKNTEGEFFTFEEYAKKIAKSQTDKDKKVVHLYASSVDGQHSYIQAARNKGYDVIVMDSPLSSHLIAKLEQKMDNVTFARVDADSIDKLIDKDEKQSSKLSDKQQEALKPIIEGVIPKEKFSVVFESMSEKDAAISITQPEFSRRMKDMNELGGGGMMSMMGQMPEIYNLIVNSNHPFAGKLLKEKDKKKQKQLAKQATDLALLSQNMLKGEELTNFIERSMKLI